MSASGIDVGAERPVGRDLRADAATCRTPVLDQLLSHRSVRRYSKAALPGDVVEVALAAAQAASTGT